MTKTYLPTEEEQLLAQAARLIRTRMEDYKDENQPTGYFPVGLGLKLALALIETLREKARKERLSEPQDAGATQEPLE